MMKGPRGQAMPGPGMRPMGPGMGPGMIRGMGPGGPMGPGGSDGMNFGPGGPPMSSAGPDGASDSPNLSGKLFYTFVMNTNFETQMIILF